MEHMKEYIDIIIRALIPICLTGSIFYLKALSKRIKNIGIIQMETAKKDIVCVYKRHKKTKTISIEDKADVLKLGKAYTELGGNGEVKLMLGEISNWETVIINKRLKEIK